MGFTIRTLSVKAENNLARLQEDNEHINTNTRAIEFVLENYDDTCSRLEEEKKENQRLNNALFKAEKRLEMIASGFEIIQNSITESKRKNKI